MPTHYRIYKGNVFGGPVNYGAIVATTASLTYVAPALALGDDVRFAVRAWDTVSGLEERNTDATVRVTAHGTTGVDLSDRPNRPQPVAVRAGPGGTAVVNWFYSPLGQTTAPVGFKVWKSTGAISYTSAPDATVAYSARTKSYSATLTGLTDGILYHIAIRAYNAATDDGNITVYDVFGDSSAPSNVDSLTASAVVAD